MSHLRSEMSRGAPHGDGVAFQWECHQCGKIIEKGKVMEFHNFSLDLSRHPADIESMDVAIETKPVSSIEAGSGSVSREAGRWAATILLIIIGSTGLASATSIHLAGPFSLTCAALRCCYHDRRLTAVTFGENAGFSEIFPATSTGRAAPCHRPYRSYRTYKTNGNEVQS